MPKTNTYLQSIGVKVLPGESSIEALRRHAAHYHWKPKTIRKHMAVLTDRLHERANENFNDLSQLNFWLSKFGIDQQESKYKAVTLLRNVHINIYDLLEERYEKRFATVNQLRKYSMGADLIFPRVDAKAEGLQCFLRSFTGMRTAAAAG
jgi:hypothetical protein